MGRPRVCSLLLLAAVLAVQVACGPAESGRPPSGGSPGASASPGSLPSVSPLPDGPLLTPTPAGTPQPGPEWRANLVASPHTFELRRPVALVNIETGQPVAAIPAGTLTVAYETRSRGRAYWMTEYSVSRGIPNGILQSEVAAALAPAGPPPALVGTEWTRLPTDRRVVALTFDAGGDASGLASILATLDSEEAPATFFLTGRWAERYPAQARGIASTYALGNHTYSHSDLTTLSDSDATTEITGGEAAIVAVTGVDPHPLLRFPYGARDARTVALANRLGYGGIRWSVDTLGWKGAAGGQTAESVTRRVLDGLAPGEIVIMHVGAAEDGSTLDADALPGVIAGIVARGYSLVTVADFL